MIDTLIFDIDGTLWDTRAIVARGYDGALAEMGVHDIHVDAAYLTSMFGKTTQEIADLMFHAYPADQRLDMILHCTRAGRAQLVSDPCDVGYEGVKETLLELKKQYRLFVVSNCEKGYAELCFEKLGLEGILEAHLCHGDTHLPKGDTIRILMDRFGVKNAVYIGDTQGDLTGAEKAGIPFIWAAYGFGTPARWDAKLDDIRELPEILHSLQAGEI